MQRQMKINLWYVIIAFFGVLLLRDAWIAMQQVEPIPYSEFMRDLKDGNVEEIAIRQNYIEGTYRNAKPDGQGKHSLALVANYRRNQVPRSGS